MTIAWAETSTISIPQVKITGLKKVPLLGILPDGI